MSLPVLMSAAVADSPETTTVTTPFSRACRLAYMTMPARAMANSGRRIKARVRLRLPDGEEESFMGILLIDIKPQRIGVVPVFGKEKNAGAGRAARS